MEFTPAGQRWSSPPLAWQIVGLLVGGLVVAQLVTLVLTLLLPPEPQKQYDLADIARALSGDTKPRDNLQRTLQTDTPTPSGPGWLTSEKSRHELATLLDRDDAAVQLWFFTPLPFAGTARGTPRDAALDGPRLVLVDYLVAQAAPPARPASGGNPGRDGPGGDGATAFPSVPGLRAGPRSGVDGMFPAGDRAGSPSSGAAGGGTASGPSGVPQLHDLARPGQPTTDAVPRPDSIRTGPPAGGSLTSQPSGPGTPALGAPPRLASPVGAARMPGLSWPSGSTTTMPRDEPPVDLRTTPTSTPTTRAPPAVARVPEQRGARAAVVDRPAPVVDAKSPATTAGRTTPSVRSARTGTLAAPLGLLGIAPAPFVEGDFIAASRTNDGWVVVQPVPEPFPNSWQRRVLLWFAISFALIAPLGWLFARRLVRPIAGFAMAAERLGRDPTAAVMALAGPAEVGRAAHAFNRMQSRLRSFVDDRTAMIGAISHDLRTPLTRLRFRLEDVEEDLRDGMLHEVDEMEKMITSVLAFIRDASEPGQRETLDLSTIVEDVVEDAVFVGNDVRLTLNERAPVEVDAIGMRRLLANLVENAVKYGDHARVRLFTDRTDAVTEVADDGPGLPDEELERVFEPFYRASAARASDKQGSGLGLAVCRSIARAHGGDVSLMRGERGLIAQLRLPLAYGAR